MVYNLPPVEVTCKRCASRFRLRHFKLAMRDRDSYDCSVCGNTLISWNGGEMYSDLELIEAKPWPPPSDSN